MHEKRKNLQWFGHADINVIEKFVYFIIWIPSVVFPFFCLYQLSVKYQSDFAKEDFVQMSWFSWFKDVSDNEWTFWWNYAAQFAFMFSCYSLGGIVLTWKFPASKQIYYILMSYVFLTFCVSLQGVLLITCHLMLFYVMVTFFRNKIFMWIWSLVCIYFINNPDSLQFQLHTFKVDFMYENVILYSLLMSYLRLISFGCETIDVGENVSFQTFLSYNLYLPLFFNGPVLTFDLYYDGIKKPVKLNLREIGQDALTCFVYAVVLDISYYFVYAPALAQHDFILEDITQIEAMCMCWVHIMYFCVKYYVFYRFAGIFVKLGGLVSPGPPKCVSSLYTFVDMWRYFDKGLYRFLQRCIYFPLGGSKLGIKRQAIASILCFSFVSFWHGSTESLWSWAISNCCGIIMETIMLSSMEYMNARHYLGPVTYRRVCCMGGSVSIFFLIYTNMIFLVGLHASNILLWKIVGNVKKLLILLFVLYCSAQCSVTVG